MAVKRYKYWYALGYEESCNIVKTIDKMVSDGLNGYAIKHMPEADETKEHWHIMTNWNSLKNPAELKAYLKDLGLVPFPAPPQSWSGYARYLTHMDSPEKVQYAPSDVVTFGGAKDYLALCETVGDKDDYVATHAICIEELIDTYNIESYKQLSTLLRTEYIAEYKALIKHSGLGNHIRAVLRSATWERDKGL